MIGYGASGSPYDFFSYDGAGLVWQAAASGGIGRRKSSAFMTFF